MRDFLSRLLAALPDAITAGVFLTTWIAPRITGAQHVDELFMLLVLEFFVVHSSIFYAVILAMPDSGRFKRRHAFAALSVLYLLFVAVYSLSNGSAWPIGTFFWLLVSRFVHLLSAPADVSHIIGRSVKLWAASVFAYLLGAFAVVLLPVPPLGITPLLPSLQVHGSFHAHEILAWGSLYFLVQSWVKFALAAPARRLDEAQRSPG